MVYIPALAGETLTADLFNTRIVQETMAWTPFSSIGTFATGFSAGTLTPRMRKLMVAGTEVWEYEGWISVTSGTLTAATTKTAFTFNTGYRPDFEHEYATGGASSAHFPIRLGFMASGALTASVPTNGGSGTTVIWLSGVQITNPV